MKKNILFAILFFAGLFAQAQNASIGPSPINTVSEWKDDVPGYAIFKNEENRERTFTWIKREISMPQDWAVAICDPVLCYDPSTFTQSFTLQPNEADTVIVHVYPTQRTAGEVVVELLLYEEGQTDTVSGMFNFCIALDAAECSLTNVNELSEGQISIYPNPFVNDTQIELELPQATDVHLKLYNIIGRQMVDQSYGLLDGRQKLTIEGANLPKGAYLMQLYLDEQVITRKVIKH
ncbi:MAG: T9SS type A sorting domain-containing protein [Bacteroidota bacterium]